MKSYCRALILLVAIQISTCLRCYSCPNGCVDPIRVNQLGIETCYDGQICYTSKRLVSNSIRYTISKGCTSKQMCDIRYPNRLEEYNCCSKDFCNSSTTLNSSILTISLVFLLLLLF